MNGTRPLEELQVVVNFARAQKGQGPIDISSVAMSPMEDPYAHCKNPEESPSDVREARSGWYKYLPLVGFMSRPLSGPPSHVMTRSELWINIQRIGNGFSTPLSNLDQYGLDDRRWTSQVLQLQRWMHRQEGILPPWDTPQFDAVMRHASLITSLEEVKKMLSVEYRKTLANAEYTFYRKMIACGQAHSLEYDVNARCNWNLGIRWGVPRVVTSTTELIPMPPPRITRAEEREDKRIENGRKPQSKH